MAETIRTTPTAQSSETPVARNAPIVPAARSPFTQIGHTGKGCSSPLGGRRSTDRLVKATPSHEHDSGEDRAGDETEGHAVIDRVPHSLRRLPLDGSEERAERAAEGNWQPQSAEGFEHGREYRLMGSRHRSDGTQTPPVAKDVRRGRGRRASGVELFVQPLAALQAAGDVERLALSSNGRSVGGEVAGRGDEHVDACLRCTQVAVLPERRLDALDGVEVA